MRVSALLASTAVALALAAPEAAAQSVRNAPIQGRLSLNPTIGTDIDTKLKTFSRDATQSVAAAGTLFGTTYTAAATFTAKKQGFKDVYEKPLALGVDLSYGLSDSSEVFGTLSYTWGSPKTFDALTVSAAGNFGGVPVTANGTVQGKLSDFHQVGVEAGYRHFIPVAPSIRVYASGAAGITNVSKINIDLSSNGQSIVNDVKLFKNSWTYSLGLGLGLRYDLAQGIAIGAETGLRYTSRLRGDDTDLTGSFAGVNDRAGRRMVVPVRVGATVTF